MTEEQLIVVKKFLFIHLKKGRSSRHTCWLHVNVDPMNGSVQGAVVGEVSVLSGRSSVLPLHFDVVIDRHVTAGVQV